jgi:hypothetical protein
MPYEEVPEFINALRERSSVAALALESAILTASRTGEALGAKPGEIVRPSFGRSLPLE